MTTIAQTTSFADGTPPRHSPWGMPHGWKMIAPGIWQCHTASHGGWWLTDERLAAMPDELMAQNWNGKQAFWEEDSDWALVVRAFPDEFNDEMRGYAEKDRLARERTAAWAAKQTRDDITSALIVRSEDFHGAAEAIAAGESAHGNLTIVKDAHDRLAIVRGYREAQERLRDDRPVRIADCIRTGLSPEDLHGAAYAFRVYQPIANQGRWTGPFHGEHDGTV